MANNNPFDRNSLRRPEQFLNKLNQQNKQQQSEQGSKSVWSKDGKKVIVIGQQPDGTFGVVAYNVSGDIRTLISIIAGPF